MFVWPFLLFFDRVVLSLHRVASQCRGMCAHELSQYIPPTIMDSFQLLSLGRGDTTTRTLKKAICLFMDVLGLCSTQAFTSCGEQEILSSCSMWASHCSGSWLLGFSCCEHKF